MLKNMQANIHIFGLNFIQDIKKGIENLKEFDLPLMYTLYDQLLRPVEFLNQLWKKFI